MNPCRTIVELHRMLDGTSIATLSLSTPAETITLRREPGGIPACAEPPPDRLAVTAPCSGVFLSRHPLRTAPLVQPGQAVRAGTVVGLLRVGPLLLHVTAPGPGTVAAVVAADDAVVGYGTVLVELTMEAEQ